MAIALSLEPKQYILESDREAPTEEQTIFHIRPLTYRERCQLSDGLLAHEANKLGPKKEETFTNIKSGTWEMGTIMFGLVQIENLKDHAGAPLEYKCQMPKEKRLEVLSRLKQEWLAEIAAEVRAISGLGREEEKN